MQNTKSELVKALTFTKKNMVAKASKLQKLIEGGHYDMVERLAKEIAGIPALLQGIEEELTEVEKAERAAARKTATGWAIVDAFVEEMLEQDSEWLKAAINTYHTNFKAFEEAGYNKTTKALIRGGYVYGMELLEKDAAARKLDLKAKVEKKVGTIEAANLEVNPNGGFDGTVKGTNGSVYIQTIVAGGWNIQRAHYRTLVK